MYFLIGILGILGHFFYGLIKVLHNERGDFFGGGDDNEDEGSSRVAQWKPPTFETDPLFTETQNYLYPYAKNILEGKPSDYFKAIGEYGGADFESLMRLTNRDTARGVDENMVRRGLGRSGVGASVTAKAIADAGTKMRFSDYSRAMAGRLNLLNTGLNAMSGVRQGAYGITGMKNQFNLGVSGDLLNQASYLDKMAYQREADQNAMWGDIFSSGLGALGTIGGALIGGPAGAMAGGILGSAVGNDVLTGMPTQMSQFEL